MASSLTYFKHSIKVEVPDSRKQDITILKMTPQRMTIRVIPHRMTITMTLIRTNFVRMKLVRTTFNIMALIRMTLRMTLRMAP